MGNLARPVRRTVVASHQHASSAEHLICENLCDLCTPIAFLFRRGLRISTQISQIDTDSEGAIAVSSRLDFHTLTPVRRRLGRAVQLHSDSHQGVFRSPGIALLCCWISREMPVQEERPPCRSGNRGLTSTTHNGCGTAPTPTPEERQNARRCELQGQRHLPGRIRS